jgi:rfaE bifunctional protein kinase chain/domain
MSFAITTFADRKQMLTVTAGPSSLERAISSFSQVRATVLGDFCLDAYWMVDTEKTELSIETGLPVRRVRSQRYSLGGAGNVVANLFALGVGQVQAIGVVGADPFGGELLRLLRELGPDVSSGMIVDERWQTMVYTKPHCGDAEESRIDFGSFNVLRDETIGALISALEAAASASNVVVLNQQVPTGLSNPSVIEEINEVIRKHPDTAFVVDARHHSDLFRGAVLKLNMREAADFLKDPTDTFSAEKARDLGRLISKRTGKTTFLTQGERGIIVADGDLVHEIPGIQVGPTIDPVGAGDTVVAAIAAGLGSRQSAIDVAKLANIAAAITVQKLQTTGTATPAEILALSDPDYNYEPELAGMLHRARYISGTEIEQIGDGPTPLSIEHCIFDHDGTLSTLREGWEKIMEPMMVRAVLGSRYAVADTLLFNKTTEEVRAFIDRTTGVQTLVQMKGLVELVKRAGYTEEGEILDEHGYKRIYNEQLIKLVRQRLKKLQSGELDPLDFQIKNASLLLRELHKRGVKLYLASGTDEVDLIAEAEVMGYADYFEGRIFGAVGDIRVEAKKIVLERLIRENGLAGQQFATFGDGPVEIRETRKRGGFSIGVASDEVRRFGLNLTKRSRLIRAGASLIVPDYSQLAYLLHAMQLS